MAGEQHKTHQPLFSDITQPVGANGGWARNPAEALAPTDQHNVSQALQGPVTPEVTNVVHTSQIAEKTTPHSAQDKEFSIRPEGLAGHLWDAANIVGDKDWRDLSVTERALIEGLAGQIDVREEGEGDNKKTILVEKGAIGVQGRKEEPQILDSRAARRVHMLAEQAKQQEAAQQAVANANPEPTQALSGRVDKKEVGVSGPDLTDGTDRDKFILDLISQMTPDELLAAGKTRQALLDGLSDEAYKVFLAKESNAHYDKLAEAYRQNRIPLDELLNFAEKAIFNGLDPRRFDQAATLNRQHAAQTHTPPPRPPQPLQPLTPPAPPVRPRPPFPTQTAGAPLPPPPLRPTMTDPDQTGPIPRVVVDPEATGPLDADRLNKMLQQANDRKAEEAAEQAKQAWLEQQAGAIEAIQDPEQQRQSITFAATNLPLLRMLRDRGNLTHMNHDWATDLHQEMRIMQEISKRTGVEDFIASRHLKLGVLPAEIRDRPATAAREIAYDAWLLNLVNQLPNNKASQKLVKTLAARSFGTDLGKQAFKQLKEGRKRMPREPEPRKAGERETDPRLKPVEELTEEELKYFMAGRRHKGNLPERKGIRKLLPQTAKGKREREMALLWTAYQKYNDNKQYPVGELRRLNASPNEKRALNKWERIALEVRLAEKTDIATLPENLRGATDLFKSRAGRDIYRRRVQEWEDYDDLIGLNQDELEGFDTSKLRTQAGLKNYNERMKSLRRAQAAQAARTTRVQP